ncbi:MAG: ERF family protein [Flavobacteriales bacterium]|nr:ERF family protein [Flavobacteriales bacterium]
MSELNIHQRIAAVMQAIAYVQKENKKVNNQYTFVSHDAVTAAVRTHLIDNGIVVIPTVTKHIQDGNRTEVDLNIDFVNIDKPEDKISVQMFGYGVDQQDKGPGKAFSYAKKYAFLQLFLLETGDDPERDNIDHRKTSRTKTAVHKDMKAAAFKMTQTATIEAFESFLAGDGFQKLIKELRSEWPEEFQGLREEKDKHKKRLEAGPKLTSEDIQLYIEKFTKDLSSEFDAGMCAEMFKIAKNDLLKAAATGEQIHEVEVAYDEHIQRLGD